MAKEIEKNSYEIMLDNEIGKVNIAEDVIAIVAGLAATEVKGVASMAGNMTREIVAKLGKKTLAKGVSVDIQEQTVSVKLALNLEAGYSIPKISAAVQDRVKDAIENMTGLQVMEINIAIASVAI